LNIEADKEETLLAEFVDNQFKKIRFGFFKRNLLYIYNFFKMKTIKIIALLLFTTSIFAQVGTNGKDRKEDGRPVKEYSLTIEENEMTLQFGDGTRIAFQKLGFDAG
jgi:hypothetical protein